MSAWLHNEIISKLCYLAGPIKTETIKKLVKKNELSDREQVKIVAEVTDISRAMMQSKKISTAKRYRDWILYTERSTRGKMIDRRSSVLKIEANLANKYIQARYKSQNLDR